MAVPSDPTYPCSSLPTIEALDSHLNKWYHQTFSRYVDLVGDFAGQEFIVVDGEGLLQFVFNDPTLDLGGSRGGPILILPTHVELTYFRFPNVALYILSGALSSQLV